VVDTDTATDPAMLARDGIALMVMHTAKFESLSSAITVVGSENVAAKKKIV
jgi:hypothetical protein